MKIRRIDYPTTLDKIANIYNDNIDVFVETQDGLHLVMTVCTPQFYMSYMEKEGIDYIPGSPPDIIVKALTHENILRALESFCEDEGYWLKTFYLLGNDEKFYSKEDLDEMILNHNKKSYEKE